MRKRTKKERGKEGRTFAADGDAERLDEVKVGRLTEVRTALCSEFAQAPSAREKIEKG